MVLVLALFACGDNKDASGDAANGATLYGATCQGCHGADGKQGTVIGGAASSDLTVEVPEQSDSELTSVMLDGYEEMPSQFTDAQDAADCLAYLRETFP